MISFKARLQLATVMWRNAQFVTVNIFSKGKSSASNGSNDTDQTGDTGSERCVNIGAMILPQKFIGNNSYNLFFFFPHLFFSYQHVRTVLPETQKKSWDVTPPPE